MQLRWRRLIPGALLAEALPVFLLILYVFLAGPGDPEGAAEFAAATGRWFGPVVGALATLGIAYWVARRADNHRLRHGLVLGLLVAGLDALLLIAGGTSFEWLFVISGLGRVLAGLLGGWLAERASDAR